MKIQVEIADCLAEDEIIIRSNSLSQEILKIQTAIVDMVSMQKKLAFWKEDTYYYLSLEDILFFETQGNDIHAHTAKDVYQVKHRLYELEEMLPGIFMRVSKSTILNTAHIYAVTKSISMSCMVEFQGTHKQVYVSRHYYKPLKNRLEEKR